MVTRGDWARATVAGAWVLVTLAACSRSAPGPHAELPARPEPPLGIAADASLPSALAPDAGPILAWTDEAAIAGLARTCDFTPPRQADTPLARSRDPLACALEIEQACIADPCFHEDETTCKQQCGTTCGTCGTSCVASCQSCKSSCKDDACRLKCAASCGRCRQDCLTERDRCATGHCTDVYKECRTKLVSTWLGAGCDGVCDRFTKKCGIDSDCWEKSPQVVACKANVVLCPEMRNAPERRDLDPTWKANHCEDVCAKIWACAKTRCDKSGCVEPAKEFEGCSQRVAGSRACGTVGIDGMMRCPEP